MSEGQASKEQKAEKKINSFEGVVCSNAGSDTCPVYKRIYVEKLDRSLVRQVDTFNMFDFIQASKSQTDLAILEKRFIELGEIPSVDPSMTSADFVGYPEDIHEVYKMANDIAGNFGKLPESIQKIFGTKEAYLRSLMDGTYQATLLNAVNNLKAAGAQEAAPEEKKGE